MTAAGQGPGRNATGLSSLSFYRVEIENLGKNSCRYALFPLIPQRYTLTDYWKLLPESVLSIVLVHSGLVQ